MRILTFRYACCCVLQFVFSAQAVTTWTRNVTAMNTPAFYAAGVPVTNGSYLYYAGGVTNPDTNASYIYPRFLRLDVSSTPPQWTVLPANAKSLSQANGCFDSVTSTAYFARGISAFENYPNITSFPSLPSIANMSTWAMPTDANGTYASTTNAIWARNGSIWLCGGGDYWNSLALQGLWRGSPLGAWTQMNVTGIMPTKLYGGNMYGVVNADQSLDLYLTSGYVNSAAAPGSLNYQNLTLYRCHGANVTTNAFNCIVLSANGPFGWIRFGQALYNSRIVAWGANQNGTSLLSIWSIDYLDPTSGWINDTPTNGTRPNMTMFVSGLIYQKTLWLYGGVTPLFKVTDTDLISVDLSSRIALWYPSTITAVTTATPTASLISNTPVTTEAVGVSPEVGSASTSFAIILGAAGGGALLLALAIFYILTARRAKRRQEELLRKISERSGRTVPLRTAEELATHITYLQEAMTSSAQLTQYEDVSSWMAQFSSSNNPFSPTRESKDTTFD